MFKTTSISINQFLKNWVVHYVKNRSLVTCFYVN
jgi:hypothetical protein